MEELLISLIHGQPFIISILLIANIAQYLFFTKREEKLNEVIKDKDDKLFSLQERAITVTEKMEHALSLVIEHDMNSQQELIKLNNQIEKGQNEAELRFKILNERLDNFIKNYE